MKRELIYAPFLGQYALKIGCVPVNRGKRGAAIQKMKADVAAGHRRAWTADHLPTRHSASPPGPRSPTRSGPASFTNKSPSPALRSPPTSGSSGRSAASSRKPGLAVVEFLPPIAPGLPIPQFMATLEERGRNPLQPPDGRSRIYLLMGTQARTRSTTSSTPSRRCRCPPARCSANTPSISTARSWPLVCDDQLYPEAHPRGPVRPALTAPRDTPIPAAKLHLHCHRRAG